MLSPAYRFSQQEAVQNLQSGLRGLSARLFKTIRVIRATAIQSHLKVVISQDGVRLAFEVLFSSTADLMQEFVWDSNGSSRMPQDILTKKRGRLTSINELPSHFRRRIGRTTGCRRSTYLLNVSALQFSITLHFPRANDRRFDTWSSQRIDKTPYLRP